MRVRVLPATVADQIAAGEVVERAASVVKELCENALDAGATRIDVEIEGGGRRLVRVVDDGSGMERDDAVMALRRHATSKIASVDDLWGLRSFGFRGEALPSIAAVSRMSLLTKSRGSASPAGLRIDIEGGQVVREVEVGMPDGTQIEVRDLFFNTPARLKFQKTEATEAGNVAEAVVRLALAHEGVHFRLRTAGRTTLDLPAHRSRAERVRAALARRGAGVLQEATGSAYGVNVQAFLAAPEEASTAARSTFLFVGPRFVRDRALLHALSLGYGDLLEKGRYPLAVLFVDVPGQELDINVHPQKLEVRFARAQEVYGAVREVVAAALARAPWRSRRRAHSLPPPSAEEEAADLPGWMGASAPEGTSRVVQGRVASAGALPPSVAAAGTAPGSSPRPTGRLWAPRGAPAPYDARAFQARADVGATKFRDVAPERGALSDREERQGGAGPVRLPAGREVGVVHGCGVVLETPDGVLVVDGHVLLSEEIRASLVRYDGPLLGQPLLFPMPVAVEVPAELRAGTRAALEDLGFAFEAWEESEMRLTALPAVASEADPKPLVLDVLAALRRASAGGEAQAREAALAVLACHATDDAAARLTEIREALERFTPGEQAGTSCWHGRPLVRVLPWRSSDDA